MIFDTIEKIESYRGLSPAFDAAVSVLSGTDFTQLQPGTYYPEPESAGVYYMVQTPELLPRDKTRWECHDRYIDIQYVVSGSTETIDWAPRGELTGWKKGASGDIYFTDGDIPYLSLALAPGRFAVFFPQDAHRPCQGASGSSRKIVFKVPVL